MPSNCSYQNQGASCGPRRDRGKDRRKEDGDDEAEASGHSGKASSASLRYSRARLDKDCHRRQAEQTADGDAQGVGAVGDGGPGKVAPGGVGDAGEPGHTVQGRCTVENIDVQEGEEGQGELSRVGTHVPVVSPQEPVGRVKADDLLKKVEP
jgi:hypothetical protein